MNPYCLRILGCGSALPDVHQFHASQVLEVASSKLYMIDCGEGAQIRLWSSGCKFSRLHQIFISHLHADHCLGLVGLISSYALQGRRADIDVYSPPGLKEIVQPQLDFFCSERQFEVHFHSFSPYRSEVIYEDKYVLVRTLPLKHRVPACGFLFKEHERERRLRKDMLQAFNVPIAAMRGIKNGDDFVDERGVLVPNARLTLPPEPPHSYAYCSDTLPLERNVSYIEGVDCLFHEATFLHEDLARAKETNHTTALQAAQIAQMAKVKQLVIGHFSARYKSREELLQEAQQVFAATHLAYDGAEFRF